MASVPPLKQTTPVMLFDGKCFFCNATVHFVMRFEHAPLLRFAALQSKAGKKLLLDAGRQDVVQGTDVDNLGSFVIIDEKGQVYTKFAASIQMFRFMGGIWRVFGAFSYWFIPSFLGNACYSLGWRYRYKVMGKSDTCIVPNKKLRERLIVGGEEFDE